MSDYDGNATVDWGEVMKYSLARPAGTRKTMASRICTRLL